MGFGRKLPKGTLPVYSVRTAAEARALLSGACTLGLDGHYYATELIEEQSLENLQRFSDRLHAVHERLRAAGRCQCRHPSRPSQGRRRRRVR